MRPRLLIADPRGRVLEHPYLLASARSGEELLLPDEQPIRLPEHGRLAQLPGRLPVGVDPASGELVLVQELGLGRNRFIPTAVGALLPPGFTRTFLPGEVKAAGPVLPQWAYTAAGWNGGPVAWAIRTDRRAHWSPGRFSTTELPSRVRAHLARFGPNRVLTQLEKCALIYRCFTSQNIFYCRDEGAIPSSVGCNARCLGCISEQPEDGPPASHQRIEEAPTAEEMSEVGAHHLAHAQGRVMVSFGQGCEGEPLTRHRTIAQAIRQMRARTRRGSINLNTNASLPRGMEELLQAGLDAVRVSLNSAVPELYQAYYRPVKYGLPQVEESMALARRHGAYLALNLLVFPGVSDRQGEVEALLKLVRRHRVQQVQARSLCIDPLVYLEVARGRGGGGPPMGVRQMLRALKQRAPWLRIGNFAQGRHERGDLGPQKK